jgi:hypothetical protein
MWLDTRQGLNTLFIFGRHRCSMRIEKRTMNWQPKVSTFDQMEAARKKRRAWAQATLQNSQALQSNFINGNLSQTQGAVNLTINQAVARVRSGEKPKV